MKRLKVFTLRLSDDEFRALKYLSAQYTDGNIASYLRQCGLKLGEMVFEKKLKKKSKKS